MVLHFLIKGSITIKKSVNRDPLITLIVTSGSKIANLNKKE